MRATLPQTSSTLPEVQHKCIYDTLPQIPPNIDGVSIGDIPYKYMKTRSRFPSQGLCIDANSE